MKLKIRIDDPETRALWETVKRAKAEVESWPAWKRGETVPHTPASAGPASPASNGHVVEPPKGD